MSWHARGSKETVITQLEGTCAQSYTGEAAKAIIQAHIGVVKALPDAAPGRVLVVVSTGHVDATRPPATEEGSTPLPWAGTSGTAKLEAEYIAL